MMLGTNPSMAGLISKSILNNSKSNLSGASLAIILGVSQFMAGSIDLAPIIKPFCYSIII